MIIKIDSREQLPLEFKRGGGISDVKVEGLPYGDYWAEDKDGREFNWMFERKSISDLFGTIANKENHARFKRELERARVNNSRLFLIIEGTQRDIWGGIKYSQAKGPSILKAVYTMWGRYGLEPVFCQDRPQMIFHIEQTFKMLDRLKPEGCYYEPKVSV